MDQDTYLTVGVNGWGDRLEVNPYYEQLNTYVYSLGARWYPFHTGLVLGASLGPAVEVLNSNIGIAATSQWCFGSGLTLAYDFARKPTGFSLELGLHALEAYIEQESVTAGAAYLAILWK